MGDIAIKVENLSKAYQLGDFGTGTLSSDLQRWWALMRNKEDPFLKIGQENDRTKKGDSSIVWSLRDINFDIKQGEAVGIIGRNGAGKSTLLKILSRVTSPTKGNIKVKGRIASLLEVGTGFHPELTGRENIFLNGAILGMRKTEIKRNFDAIVDFAGVERYINTPVKRYSSGMYVRLAFAVAAYLESEILVVDEVLAVGDTEFQKKCLGKMNDLNTGEGRTVLFVSHNMGSIQQLCKKCLLLNNGELIAFGNNETVIGGYLTQETRKIYKNDNSDKSVFLSSAYIDGNTTLNSDEIVLHIVIKSSIYTNLSFDVRFYSSTTVPIGFGSIGTFKYKEQLNIQPGNNHYKIGLDVSKLALGNYSLSFDLTVPNVSYYERVENCLSLEILRLDENDRRMSQSWGYGSVLIPLKKID